MSAEESRDRAERGGEPGARGAAAGRPIVRRSGSPPAARPAPSRPAPSRSRSFRSRRRLLTTALLVAVAVAAAAAVARFLGVASPAVELPIAGRLALLPFAEARADRGGDWVEWGLMEMVAETLSRTAGPAVVAPERLRKVLEPRALDLGDPAARELARRLALAAGADQVLDARVQQRDGETAIDFELVDAGGVVAGGGLRGGDAFEAGDELAFSLARGLTSDREPRRLRRAFSRSPFFDRLYATGLQVLRTSGPEAAEPYFEIALTHQPGFYQARERLAECARRLGDLERARELTGELLAEAQSRGDRVLETRSLKTLALLAAMAGDLEQASGLYDQALALYVEAEDPPGQAEVLFELARLALARGEEPRAEELYVERLAIQQSLGDRLGEADTLFQIGSLLLAAGDLEGAGRVLGDASDLAVASGDVWTEMRLAASLGEVAQRRGQLEEAERLWRRALTFYDQRREHPRRLLLSYKLSEVLAMAGELDEAEDRLQDVRELAVELEDPAAEARASLGLAWLMLRTGYPYQAKPHLDRALELDRWLDNRVLLQLVIAWFAYEQGNYALAVETQSRVKEQFAGWGKVEEAFLRVFREARLLGRRLPLPGEDDYQEATDSGASPASQQPGG